MNPCSLSHSVTVHVGPHIHTVYVGFGHGSVVPHILFTSLFFTRLFYSSLSRCSVEPPGAGVYEFSMKKSCFLASEPMNSRDTNGFVSATML